MPALLSASKIKGAPFVQTGSAMEMVRSTNSIMTDTAGKQVVVSGLAKNAEIEVDASQVPIGGPFAGTASRVESNGGLML